MLAYTLHEDLNLILDHLVEIFVVRIQGDLLDHLVYSRTLADSQLHSREGTFTQLLHYAVIFTYPSISDHSYKVSSSKQSTLGNCLVTTCLCHSFPTNRTHC